MAPIREFNFGSGMPDPTTFPSQALADAAARILPRLGSTLVKYPDGRGWPALREIAVDRFAHNHGIQLPIEQVVLTSGSMQGLMLVAQALAERGAPVVVEEFTYSGTLRIFRQHGLELLPVPMDSHGMRIEVLETLLERQAAAGRLPAFIYTIASFQNPSGTTLPLERRHQLLALAKKYGVLIVEDDCYADVSFGAPTVPALYRLGEPGSVVYIGSFSKILGPGIRLGYFAAPEALTARMMQWKMDGGTSNLAAMIVAEYFREHLWNHIDDANVYLKRKLETLLESLERSLAGSGVTWTRPDGGLFVWLSLPPDTDRQRIADLARERGILYGTGRAFDALDRDVPFLRLAFGFIAREDVPDGVRLLADVVAQAQPAAAQR